MGNLSEQDKHTIQHFKHLLQQSDRAIGEIRSIFLEHYHSLNPDAEVKHINFVWGQIMHRPKAKLLAMHRVTRTTGNGQLSLYEGDVFSLHADQWICSSFQGIYAPFGGVWISFWEAATRIGRSWNDHKNTIPNTVSGAQQVVWHPVNPVHPTKDALPTIVLHGKRSDIWRKFYPIDPISCIERVYTEALFVIRQMSRKGLIGRRVAMPILFSMKHGVDYVDALKIQKEFAIDLLHREPVVKEVMVCVREQGEQLLSAYHVVTKDQSAIVRTSLETWLQDGITVLSQKIYAMLHVVEDADLRNNVLDFIGRLEKNTLYVNDLAVLARVIVEDWANAQAIKHNLRVSTLYNLVNQLRSLSGTPNRAITYLDAIRVLGNVGAHHLRAPHKLYADDIITMLQGLKALIQLDIELN